MRDEERRVAREASLERRSLPGASSMTRCRRRRPRPPASPPLCGGLSGGTSRHGHPGLLHRRIRAHGAPSSLEGRCRCQRIRACRHPDMPQTGSGLFNLTDLSPLLEKHST